jgi:hypothetical protein
MMLFSRQMIKHGFSVAMLFHISSTCVASDPPFQSLPVILSASDFLPQVLLTGDNYSVSDRVSNDGFTNMYTIASDYGEYTVEGTAQLRTRIHEIKATRAIEELERSDAFVDAMKGSVTGAIEGGKALVKAPIDTGKKAVKGLGRWLGNVGSSFSSDDPDQENAVATILGYDAVKRAYALEFGVDPYTDFAPFQERLGEIAKASTAGSLVTSAAADAATKGTITGTVLDIASIGKMKNILKDNPPATLDRINEEKLLEMGISEYQIDAFFKNYNYSPSDEVLLVEALRRMGDIKGREIFFAYATAAPDPTTARYMQQRAEMMANYINDTERGDIIKIGRTAWLLTRTGSVVGLAPIDYLAWTPDAAAALDMVDRYVAERDGIKGKELWIEGQIDPAAERSMRDRDWIIKTGVGLAYRMESEMTGGKPDGVAHPPVHKMPH